VEFESDPNMHAGDASDEEESAVDLLSTNRRATSYFPAEKGVTNSFYEPFLEVIFQAMLSVHHPHVGNKNECVQKWCEITAWAFTPPRGPLRSFKQWTGPEERKYIKFRKSKMHAVSYCPAVR